MRRILITGNAGSGKTTLAMEVAAFTGLPYIGLDRIVWQPKWQKTPKVERTRQGLLIANQETWVVDGVSHTLLEAADIIVFLDFPRHLCLLRAFRRNLPYLFRSRPGLPEQCPEILIIPTLMKIIWLFPKCVRPHILETCQSTRKLTFHIRSRADFQDFRAAIRLQYGPTKQKG